MGSASDPLVERLGWSVEEIRSVELGTRFGLLEQLRVLAHLAASSKRVGPQRLSSQSVHRYV